MVLQLPNRIDIQWNAPDDGGSPLTGFIVYSDGATGSFEPLEPVVESGSITTYSITLADHGISAGESYGIRVSALNDVGESQASDSVHIIAAQVPDAPTNLITSAASDVSVTIEWQDPSYDGGSPVTDYKVYWNEGVDEGPFVLLSDTTFGHNTFTKQTDLEPGTYYEFKVVAMNAVGASAYSDKTRIIAASAPDPPSSLSLVSQNKVQVTFEWQAPSEDGGSPVLDYEVYGDQGDDGLAVADFQLLSATTYLTREYTETAVEAGETYRFVVKARNDAGLGEASAVISIQAATPPSAPDTPTVVFQNEQTIEIAWSSPDDDGSSTLLNFIVYWDQGSGTYVPLATTDASTFDFAQTTGLTTGDLYAFKVAASNAIDEGN
jgi:titin